MNGPAGTNYQYTNSAHPHAVTSVNTPDGTDSYTYDASGNRATWVDANGPDFAYSWDVEGRMTKNVSTDAQTPAARSSVTTHNGSGSTTLSLPPPTGTRTGDVLVTSIVVSSPGANKAPPTVTAPAGWTLVATSANANVRTAVFVYPNTVATPWSNTFTFSVAAKAVGGMTSYINVDTSNPIDVSAVGSNTSGTSHVAPSVVTSGVNRLLTSVTGLAVTSSVTPPVTMTERIDAATPTGTKSATIETADHIVFTAGATGTRTSTSPTAATSQTVTFALRPIPIQSEYLYDTDRTVVLRKDAYATFLTLGEFVDLHVVPTGNPWSHRSFKIGGEEVAKNSGGVREWFFNDRQGSVTTTGSDSTIISAARRSHYTPWGKIRASSAPDPITWYQYIGALDEPNNQLIYLNNRHYDPTTGIFISVDPLIAKTGQPYLYAAGNPTTLSDPNGLDPGWAHDNDPCNDAGYYSCGVAPQTQPGQRTGGWSWIGAGHRQILEKANGIGIDRCLSAPSGCLNEGKPSGDTDVCSGHPEFCDANPRASGLTTEEELALIGKLEGMSPGDFFDLATNPTEIKKRGLGWLNWSNDGCSNSPDGLWGNSLLGPCARHDFTYRNRSAWEDATGQNIFSEDARRRADDRLGDGIRDVCSWTCDWASFPYWGAVHGYGDGGPLPLIGGGPMNPNPLPWDGLLPILDWGPF